MFLFFLPDSIKFIKDFFIISAPSLSRVDMDFTYKDADSAHDEK